ncbi:MAG: hypothetical protein HY000_25215 [Planctomycetes bacterium]|nr:hypothetical protein [Planctomycetota bacterium]
MGRRAAQNWKCPNCGRAFAKNNQWHSCEVHTVEDHFRGKPPVLKKTFDRLVARLGELGPLRVDAVKSTIHFFASKFCFGGVYVRKDHVRLSFLCEDAIQDTRIVRTLRVGPRRVGHRVKLTSPSDVNERLMSWLRKSYKLQS